MITTTIPPAAETAPGHMTEDQFVAWCDEDTRAEWKNGEIIMPSPASTIHVRLTCFLLQCLGLYASRSALGEVLGPEMQVRFAALRRRRAPDVLFVARERAAIILPNHVPAEDAVRSTVLAGFFIRPARLWQDPLPNPLDVLCELGVLPA